MLELTILLVLVSNAGGETTIDPCDGSSTRQLEQCASLRLEEATGELEEYLVASKNLTGADEAGSAALLESQDFWRQFIEVDCRAAYEHARGGSIRSLVMLECKRGHTRSRTLQLWNRYLAGTTSELPEPKWEDHPRR